MLLVPIQIARLACFTLGSGELALARLGRFLEMLVFLVVGKNPRLFAELVEATQCFFKRFVVAYTNSGQSVHPFRGAIWLRTDVGP